MSNNTGYIILAINLIFIGIMFIIFNRPDKKKIRIKAKIKKRDSNTVISTVIEVGADRSYNLPQLKKKYANSKKFFQDYTIVERMEIKKV